MFAKFIPSAEPFYFRGNQTGCLLVHGFTGSPEEMKNLGKHLNQIGYTVLGVRLAGHATNVTDLSLKRWQDWYASVLDGYYLLKGDVSDIFIVGLSLGGVLALLLASEHPVKGVACLSVPYHMPPDPRLPYLKFMKYFIHFIKKTTDPSKKQRCPKGHVEYDAYPLKSIIEMDKVLAAMRSVLKNVTCPVLIVHSKDDTAALPINATLLHRQLPTPRKELVWLTGCNHNILCSKQQHEVTRHVVGFISRNSVNSRCTVT